jgi:hypothetical protein
MPPAMPRAPNPLVIFSLQWFEAWRCAAELSTRNLEEMRRLRNRMLQEMSLCMESYMKSPAFLELMRYNMAVLGHTKGGLGAPSVSGAIEGNVKGRSVRDARSAPVPVMGPRRSVGGPPASVSVMGHPRGKSVGGAPSASVAVIGHSKARSIGKDPSASVTSSWE